MRSSDKNANLKEKLKQALTSTFKVISDDFNVKSGLENIYSRFKTLTDIALKDDSNLSGVNSILKKIEKQLEEATLKVQSIKERQ